MNNSIIIANMTDNSDLIIIGRRDRQDLNFHGVLHRIHEVDFIIRDHTCTSLYHVVFGTAKIFYVINADVMTINDVAIVDRQYAHRLNELRSFIKSVIWNKLFFPNQGVIQEHIKNAGKFDQMTYNLSTNQSNYYILNKRDDVDEKSLELLEFSNYPHLNEADIFIECIREHVKTNASKFINLPYEIAEGYLGTTPHDKRLLGIHAIGQSYHTRHDKEMTYHVHLDYLVQYFDQGEYTDWIFEIDCFDKDNGLVNEIILTAEVRSDLIYVKSMKSKNGEKISGESRIQAIYLFNKYRDIVGQDAIAKHLKYRDLLLGTRWGS